MYEVDFEDWDLAKLNREDTVAYINGAYNKDSKLFYTNHTDRLNKLSDKTLDSILRIIIIANASTKRNRRGVLNQFIRRWECSPKNVARFATLVEQEYFSVLNTLVDTYGIAPNPHTIGKAMSGVLTYEDMTNELNPVKRRQIALVLAAIGWFGSVETYETGTNKHGPYVSLNDDAFYDYIETERPDEERHRVLSALCSGQKYTRFLEVIESANGATKSLITGTL